MKKPLIIANWKSNQTIKETEQWFRQITAKGTLPSANFIICPPFTTLERSKYYIQMAQLPFALGAQDISPFPKGAYTGEVSAEMLAELVDYVIIGHSERRTHFQENDTVLTQKVEQAVSLDLEPIYCIQDTKTTIPESVKIVAFEPVTAIGTGQPDTPDHAGEVGLAIKAQRPDRLFLYGGSVKTENIASFFKKDPIDGVLVGGASLDPNTFYELARNAETA